jgi:type I restriction enzyme M protein
MTAEQIAKKLWDLCNILRDDGVTYHQYLNELTYILFLRLSEIKKFDEDIPENYRWSKLKGIKDNKELFDAYRDLLANLGTLSSNESIKEIYTNASTTLRKPVNLRTLITSIDQIDWFEDEEQDKIASIYEELLEKNAGEKKSGAGQYFTPRPLINVMVDLISPKLEERWNDPAAGTFGFMIAANEYVKSKSDDYFDPQADKKWQESKAFTGCELVQDAHRLALMNAKLHGLESRIVMGDTMTELGKTFKNYDGVLANPPFGTKQGGEQPSRDDFTIKTSNKQLNFLQHIYRSLRKDKGTARAAVVLPDNVLFEDGDGRKIRKDLMDKCDLHTILRLPTGIFYAAGVKTNVLFFTRGKTETGNTKRVWFYDMRTNAPSYGKRTVFSRDAFDGFVKAYTGGIGLDKVKDEFDGTIDDMKRAAIKDERWQQFTRDQILAKNDSLDSGLIEDESVGHTSDLGEPIEIAKEAMAEIKIVSKELDNIIRLLKG